MFLQSHSSIAQSRQGFSALIAAAQTQPQAIVRHQKPVAIMVSPEFYSKALAADEKSLATPYERLMQARKAFEASGEKPQAIKAPQRKKAWTRANPFADE